MKVIIPEMIGDPASYILSFIPMSWRLAVSSTHNINAEINYESEFPACNRVLLLHGQLSVKKIRIVSQGNIIVPPHPSLNYNKFNLVGITNEQPFKLLRKSLRTPRDRFFNYRILQGDIFL